MVRSRRICLFYCCNRDNIAVGLDRARLDPLVWQRLAPCVGQDRTPPAALLLQHRPRPYAPSPVLPETPHRAAWRAKPCACSCWQTVSHQVKHLTSCDSARHHVGSRPGTEPKLKYYLEVKGTDAGAAAALADRLVGAIGEELVGVSRHGLAVPAAA